MLGFEPVPPPRSTTARTAAVAGPLDVPELARQRALANGDAGRRWLDGLSDIVADLATRWDLAIGTPFTGGTAAFVVEATDGSGRACVLKVAMPLEIDGPGTFERSVLAHDLAGGRGCAELLAHDLAARALLLERLGPNLADAGLALRDLLTAVATTLRAFWRPVPADVALPTGADQAAWLAAYITSTWEALDRPCPLAVVDRAVALCEERAAAFDPTSAVLVHGDAHGWNTLEAGDGTYKLVDPEGLRSEPAHDLSVPMREYNRPLLDGDTPRLVRERAEHLAAIGDVDPRDVWKWGFIERVSTGLANLREFTDGEGAAFLAVAERCLRD